VLVPGRWFLRLRRQLNAVEPNKSGGDDAWASPSCTSSVRRAEFLNPSSWQCMWCFRRLWPGRSDRIVLCAGAVSANCRVLASVGGTRAVAGRGTCSLSVTELTAASLSAGGAGDRSFQEDKQALGEKGRTALAAPTTSATPPAKRQVVQGMMSRLSDQARKSCRIGRECAVRKARVQGSNAASLCQDSPTAM